MDNGSRPKSRLASLIFAQKLLCLNRAGYMLNIMSPKLWQDPEIMIFCYTSILRKIRSRAETPCAKFRLALSARSKDLAEKQIPAKLKPIVDSPSGWSSLTLFPFLAPPPASSLSVCDRCAQVSSTSGCFLHFRMLWDVQGFGSSPTSSCPFGNLLCHSNTPAWDIFSSPCTSFSIEHVSVPVFSSLTKNWMFILIL